MYMYRQYDSKILNDAIVFIENIGEQTTDDHTRKQVIDFLFDYERRESDILEEMQRHTWPHIYPHGDDLT